MRGSVSVANWAADAKFVQTKCDEIVPKGMCSTEAGPGSSKSGVYKHISPEYWISDGLGKRELQRSSRRDVETRVEDLGL
ncbi:hypothetical protein E2P81_ATG03330 [Venturia nashicola]|uniref:Uncharacterized protein n=1 Tax=Venturia nashicola TaxID=86259 RepID=A0A4Z1P4K6_9PEZI|nr:hypothetical protein E6O75_ATG03399 [Venturia nashicola]TLD36441.1 hypothetical protein E2P81_ATG03330 [Venturia nashicola]